MYRAKSDKVQGQQLKVQELVVRAADTQLFDANGGAAVILIGEQVDAIVSVTQHDDSVPGLVMYAASALSIVDSTAFTAGGDLKGIKATGLALAANDVVVVKYITKQ